jgi:hypothetical protein
VDGYFHVHYWNVDGPIVATDPVHGGGVYGGGACVARALVADVVGAAAAGTVTAWQKYAGGAWTEPGIRGRCTPIIDHASYAISYNTARNRYIMMSPYGGDALSETLTFTYRESLDGITWSDPPQWFAVDDTPINPLHVYITMVDPSAPVPYLTGSSFYLIAKNWDTGEIDRFLVTLTGDPISPSSSPGGPP